MIVKESQQHSNSTTDYPLLRIPRFVIHRIAVSVDVHKLAPSALKQGKTSRATVNYFMQLQTSSEQQCP